MLEDMQNDEVSRSIKVYTKDPNTAEAVQEVVPTVNPCWRTYNPTEEGQRSRVRLLVDRYCPKLYLADRAAINTLLKITIG